MKKLPNERDAGDVPDSDRDIVIRDDWAGIHQGYYNANNFEYSYQGRLCCRPLGWCELSDVLIETPETQTEKEE